MRVLTFKIRPVFASILLRETSCNPGGCAYPGIKLCHVIVDRGYYLNPRATRSDNRNAFAFEVISFVIICTVEDFSLEGLEARNGGPLPSTVMVIVSLQECPMAFVHNQLQKACAADQQVSFFSPLRYLPSVSPRKLDHPFGDIVIPNGARDCDS